MSRATPRRFVGVGLALAAVLIAAACATPRREIAPIPGLRWSSDLETGDLSQFEDTPWNTVAADPPAVVSDPALVRDGRFGMRASIPGPADSDVGTRSEVVPAVPEIRAGDDLWFGYSSMLGPGFPVDAAWQVITQWKNEGTGSPPIAIAVQDGEYQLTGGAGHPDGERTFREPIAPAVPGIWVDWTVHITFSTEGSDGYLEIWHGNELVLPRFAPESGTLYPSDDPKGPHSYLKFGYYRNQAIAVPGKVYFDNWRIGDTRAVVAPPIG